MAVVRAPEVSRRAVLGGALGALALAGLPSGCSNGSGSSPGLRALAVDVPRSPVTLADAPHLADVVAGMRGFVERLHRATASATADWTASPLSLAVAFGMLRAGARGQTAAQIDEVLGFPVGAAGEGSPHPALNALTADLVTSQPLATSAAAVPSGRGAPDPVVAVANALFLDEAFAARVRRAYLRLLATQYGAHATAVSFADPSAVRLINAWVADQTRGRITRLFDALDPSTVFVLANAVYLKAAWLNQFDVGQTAVGRFTNAVGRPVSVPLMRQAIEGARYAETADWQRVGLSYVGSELTMRLVVPRAVLGDVRALAGLVPAATAPVAGSRAWVDLTLPRWDTGTDIGLVPVLRRLGMVDVFSGAADLSGLAPGLLVSDAVHRASITVDEEGSEAAAVTGIAGVTSAPAGHPVAVRADRPFVWAIVHEPTGAPVFVGHVVDPA